MKIVRTLTRLVSQAAAAKSPAPTLKAGVGAEDLLLGLEKLTTHEVRAQRQGLELKAHQASARYGKTGHRDDLHTSTACMAASWNCYRELVRRNPATQAVKAQAAAANAARSKLPVKPPFASANDEPPVDMRPFA